MERKWYWIELIGFDCTVTDYGVEAFLGRLSQLPEGVALLFSNIDFINGHRGGADEYDLRPCDCSYNGHRYGMERERQVWTNVALCGLVEALHARGVKVLFGCFDFYVNGNDDGSLFYGAFTAAHEELRPMDKNGDRTYLGSVLNRFRDGTYYEDYLAKKIDEVIDYYGFDGVQLADGLSSARLSLQNGDCSDDLFDQFLTATGEEFPSDIKRVCGDDREAYRLRRDWIFTHKHFEWIRFLSDRWARYYENLLDVICISDRIVLFNTAWTRNPFEALYRYGIDYGKIYSDRLYAAMVEETSATLPILSSEDNGGFYLPPEARRYYHYEFMLMQMKLKAYLPSLKQLSLAPVNDTTEQWDIVKHAPMEMTRAIMRRRNSFVYDGAQYVKCSDAPFYCLADGVEQSNWEYIESVEELSTDTITTVNGFSLVWPNSDALYRELKHYIDTRSYTADALSNELIKYGFPIASAVRMEDIDRVDTPLVALNPHSFDAKERAALYDTALPLVCVSTRRVPQLASKANFLYEGAYCKLYLVNFPSASTEACQALTACLNKSGKRRRCHAEAFDAHGAIWTSPLAYDTVDSAWFAAVAAFVSDALKLPRNINPEVECKTTELVVDNNVSRLLISNDEFCYALPEIRVHRPIKEIRSLVKFQGYQIPLTAQGFIIRVPPRGMELVEIKYEEV